MFKHVFTLLLITTSYLGYNYDAVAMEKPQDSVKSAKSKKSHKVIIKTQDKFKLAADYYQGDKNQGGVLLLHDCNADRKANKNLTMNIHSRGLSVLNLDFRGYGDSKTDKISQYMLRKKAKNIKSYRNAMTSLKSFWESDTFLAFQWLRNKVARNKQIAIVSFGCAVNYAVAVAEKMHVNSLVLITPKMDFSQKERYKNLIDIPTYFISSAYQLESNKTAQELFAWNGVISSKIQTFKGNYSGHSLLRHYSGLSDDIKNWLAHNLK